jgi:Flp pilus assembly pilin Flp
MVKLLRDLLRNESGMETVEWAVVAALLVVGLGVLFATLGNSIKTKLNNLNQQVQ